MSSHDQIICSSLDASLCFEIPTLFLFSQAPAVSVSARISQLLHSVFSRANPSLDSAPAVEQLTHMLPSSELWGALSDLDRGCSLTLEWKESLCREKLFNSLRIPQLTQLQPSRLTQLQPSQVSYLKYFPTSPFVHSYGTEIPTLSPCFNCQGWKLC